MAYALTSIRKGAAPVRLGVATALAFAGASLVIAATLGAGARTAEATPSKSRVGDMPTASVRGDADPFVRRFASADASTGAMFRWPWPNAAVDRDELVAQVDAVADAGYKGLEIASVLGLGAPPFPGTNPAEWGVDYPVDPDKYGYGTPRWIEAVEAVLLAARKRGLQIDLTLGAHWPPAVPGLDVDGPGSTKELTYGYRLTDGGAAFRGPVPQPAPRTYEDRTSNGGVITKVTRTVEPQFVGVGAVRCVQDCSGTPLLDLGSNVDLASRVVDGVVEWDPPDDGTWVLVGYWYRGTAIRNDLPFATLPTLYSDPEARAIDYFSVAGVEAFTEYFDGLLTPQIRRLLPRLRASVFDESIEIGAGAAHLWTPRFLAEFEQRRGYSLVPYLPILAAGTRSGFGGPPSPAFRFAGADVEVRDRVLRDVNQTYSDLYVDRHIKPFRRWAHELGLQYRAQPYGQPVDMAEAAAHIDAPECENFACGATDDWRLMASGADMAGKRIVSDELIPGVGQTPRPSPYMVPQTQVVAEVNEQFALGANQMIFHGLPYPHPPPSADGTVRDVHTEWPGYHPFGAQFPEAFGPRQPTWTMASDTSRYFARTQLALQTGVRRTDVAVYNQSLGHIGEAFDAGWVSAGGYTYGYVTPGSLASAAARVTNRTLAPTGPAFRALILDDQESMPLAMARRIRSFAAGHLPIVIVGDLPSATPGYAATADAAAARDRELQEIVAQILAEPSVRRVATAGDVADALALLDVEPAATSSASAIRIVRRVDGKLTTTTTCTTPPRRTSPRRRG